MKRDPSRDRLVEEVVGAYRERDGLGRIVASGAFFDLSEQDRLEAFEETLSSRALEAALDPNGLSTTARALLARVRATR